MIDVARDIHSLTSFKRNSARMMRQIRRTGRPVVLTVKGEAAAVLLDSTAWNEVAGHLDTLASVRRGLDQARRGQFRPVDEVFSELER